MDTGPRPKKSLGQHWLHDEASLEAMLQAADVNSDDVILEIGPGLGTLTTKLVQRASQVLAVEYDALLAEQLPSRVSASNLTVIQQDILTFDLTRMEPGYKVVANIPYYLTSNLVRLLSESANPPSRIALLVQKEVAQRLAARPGSMSMLSVSAQYFWQVDLSHEVPADLFTPPPKVDSQIVSFVHRQEPLFPEVDSKLFFRLVKAGFGERRKTLRNALSGGLHMTKDATQSLLDKAKIDAGLRAQSLTLDQWHALYSAYQDAV